MISKKDQDRAMEILCEYFRNPHNTNIEITSSFLYKHGFPQQSNAIETIEALCAMGYIKHGGVFMKELRDIELTASGLCYPEKRAEEKRKELKDEIRYWITTLIAVAAFIQSFFIIPH